MDKFTTILLGTTLPTAISTAIVLASIPGRRDCNWARAQRHSRAGYFIHSAGRTSGYTPQPSIMLTRKMTTTMHTVTLLLAAWLCTIPPNYDWMIGVEWMPAMQRKIRIGALISATPAHHH